MHPAVFMFAMLKKRGGKQGPSLVDIGARCPGCDSELPLTFEQQILLRSGQKPWLFCPACRRIVAGEPFVRGS
jgi:predicted  nucleic acid-binding Zn-ribbon protein